MKNILILLMVLVSIPGLTQTKIYVPGGTAGIAGNPNNYNVGIGSANPTAKLHVNGDLRASQYIAVEKAGAYRVALNGEDDGYITGRNDGFRN